MKLIYCPKCKDIVKLHDELRSCLCGASRGMYLNDQLALVDGDAVPLGVDNRSFLETLERSKSSKIGYEELIFLSFFFRNDAKNIRKLPKSSKNQ